MASHSAMTSSTKNRTWPGDPEPEFDEDEEDEGVDDLPGVNKKPRQSRRTRKAKREASPDYP